MRLPRIRMTTRRWMVAVAVVALSLGFYAFMMRLFSVTLRLARHSERVRFYENVVSDYEGGKLTGAGFTDRDVQYWYRCLRYHAAMKRKLTAAQRRPWLAVAPDPPEPDRELPNPVSTAVP